MAAHVQLIDDGGGDIAGQARPLGHLARPQPLAMPGNGSPHGRNTLGRENLVYVGMFFMVMCA